MKADEDYTTTVYVANKSDDGKTADLVVRPEERDPHL